MKRRDVLLLGASLPLLATLREQPRSQRPPPPPFNTSWEYDLRAGYERLPPDYCHIELYIGDRLLGGCVAYDSASQAALHYEFERLEKGARVRRVRVEQHTSACVPGLCILTHVGSSFTDSEASWQCLPLGLTTGVTRKTRERPAEIPLPIVQARIQERLEEAAKDPAGWRAWSAKIG